MGLTDQGVEPFRVGFLGGETIASINLEKPGAEAKRIADSPRRTDRLVGEHGHAAGRVIRHGAHGLERFKDSWIDVGVIEFVLAIAREEPVEAIFDEMLVRGISEGAANEHTGAISDIGRDDFFGQRLPVELSEHDVDGVGEIFLRVDQRAVEVKDDKANGFSRDGIQNVQHESSLTGLFDGLDGNRSDALHFPFSAPEQNQAHQCYCAFSANEGDENALPLKMRVNGEEPGEWNFENPEAKEIHIGRSDRIACSVECLQQDHDIGVGDVATTKNTESDRADGDDLGIMHKELENGSRKEEKEDSDGSQKDHVVETRAPDGLL